MDTDTTTPSPFLTRLRPYLSFEAVLVGLTLVLIVVCHGAAFEDRLLLTLYCTLIAVVIYGLVKRHAIAPVLLVVSAVAAMTMVHLYFAAKPGTIDPTLSIAGDVLFWAVLLFLGWLIAVKARRLPARAQGRGNQHESRASTGAARAVALTTAVGELHKPVSDILAVVETLLDRPAESSSDSQRDSLEDVGASARKLASLADHVLDHAKAESGSIHLAQETVALPELISQCVAAAESQAADTAVTVTAQVDPDVREIVADPQRLKETLLDLLLNSVELCETGGSVRMQVHISDAEIVVNVRDTGKGIGEDEMKRLFSPYARMSDGATGFHSRLRMSLARHLVELHGGTMTADSVAGSGSVFTVRLPKDGCPEGAAAPTHWEEEAEPEIVREVRTKVSRPAPHPESSAALLDAGPSETAGAKSLELPDEASDVIRVLVADENPTVRKIVRNMLTSLGWETIEATDGRQALERAGKRPMPHAVLLDLNLPTISGYEVCRALKSNDQLRRIPVVVTTFSDGAEEKLRALDVGADDLLSKPINRTELTVRLRSLLRMHRFNQELIGAESVALALAHAVAAKDGYAHSHLQKVASYAVGLGEAVGMDDAELKILKFGAMLHNVGKIAIPDSVLEKTGALSPREKALFQQHPRVGCDICAPLKPLQPVLPIIRQHKECWDGSGYPDGLRGDEIPLGAQIVGVADVYTAMISDRPYRKAVSHADAVATLRKQTKEGQHNPKLVEQFIAMLESSEKDTAEEDTFEAPVPAESTSS